MSYQDTYRVGQQAVDMLSSGEALRQALSNTATARYEGPKWVERKMAEISGRMGKAMVEYSKSKNSRTAMGREMHYDAARGHVEDVLHILAEEGLIDMKPSQVDRDLAESVLGAYTNGIDANYLGNRQYGSRDRGQQQDRVVPGSW